MVLTPPFVLFDDAQAGGATARLYRDPVRVIACDTVAAIPAALAGLRAARNDGLHAAGFLSYEAGEAFEPTAGRLGRPATPLLWFGLFEGFEEVEDVAAILPDPAAAWIGAPVPEIDRATYDAQLAAILDLIRAGDLYQANLTFRATARIVGDPLALYAQLRIRAGAGFGALLSTGEATILSLSPELFFSLDRGTLTCRPMKGTARRGDGAEEDRALVAGLAADEKQRAENLMIVDLMRNDLSRVAAPGTVEVPSLFSVETYPTIHQMTSTVTAGLAVDRDAIDVIAALFPCGSITGAPKVRAMQGIAGIETGSPRGVYTGSIGRLDANGDAMFNVAIRTLTIPDGADHAVLGLGSGIVADSTADAEWDEAQAKGAFVASTRRFDLIETMAFDPEEGLRLLERHLARMKESAALFGFAFDRHATRNELQAATFRLRAPAKIRLLLSPGGAVGIEVGPLPPAPAGPVEVAIVPLPASPDDIRLRHKTSDRHFYDAARAAAGTMEVLFEAPDGTLTEGSFTSLFVPRGDQMVTPAGPCLPGVLRAELIETDRAREGIVTRADLGREFFIGNAVRGLIPAVAKAQEPPL